MSKQASIKKNIGFQTAYQVLNTVLPLITAPYLARVLGASNLGIFSYTSSVVAYFVIVSMLGTVNYGTRSIAAVAIDKDKLAQTFWEIYALQAFVTIIALIAYSFYLLFFVKDNVIIACIQAVAIVDCFLNINWLYFGLEKFQITVTRSFFVRIITVVCILVFVRDQSQLWLYTVIMLSGTLLSDAILWLYLPKIVKKKKITAKKIISHLKPNIMLFIPLLAMSVYHIMDKTMLGILSSYEQTGFYYNADKIVNITVGIISGISTVLLPRMTALISEGKKRESDELFKLSLEGTTLSGIAVAFGIAAISQEFIPLFFGPGYDECIILTIVLAPVLIIKSFSFTARYQYLIPHRKEKDYTVSVIIGAIVNLVANLCFIPQYGALGAVIGTLLAEASACIWQYVSMRNMINLKKLFVKCLIYVAFGVIMFIAVRITAFIHVGVVFKITLEIITGVFIYIVLCLIFWKLSGNDIYEKMFGSVIKPNRK